jgi:putative SOS response-associated peptidase YedK
MCVRYTLHKTDAALAAIAQALARKLAPPEWAKPKYNVTLTNVTPVVATGEGGAEVRGMMWGIVPAFARKNEKMRMFPNAMAEKALKSPAWRSAVAKRRCLVPANGFYEWETVGTMKYPHLFTLRDEEPFAFAGIWEPAAEKLPETFAILTTAPNEIVKPYHHRMPVLLTKETMPRWLGSEPLEPDEYAALTRPLDPDRMTQREVNRYVNKSGNEGPECLAPPEPRGKSAKPAAPQLDLEL